MLLAALIGCFACKLARRRGFGRSFCLALVFAGTLLVSPTAAKSPVPVLLDSLEIEVARLEAGATVEPRQLGILAGNAQDALQRATSPSERVRARRVLRRVERIATGQQPLNFSTKLATHQEPASPAPLAAGGSLASSPESSAAGGLLTQYAPAIPSVEMPADAGALGSPGSSSPFINPGGIAGPGITGPSAAAPGFVPVVLPPQTLHFVNLDALAYWVKQDQVPALVTTSPIGTPQAQAGVLGLPTTSVLFGNEGVNGDARPGGRVRGGIWFSPAQVFAIEGHYWGLATATTTFTASSTFSDGTSNGQILARPFFNVSPGVDAQDAALVAYPDFFVFPFTFDLDGSIKVQESSRIQSAGGGGRYALRRFNGPLKVYLLGAYRFFQLDEGLTITAKSSPGSDPFPIPLPPGTIKVVDSFSTNNTFNGGEVGVGVEWYLKRFTLSLDSRLALGNMRQSLDIAGSTSAISGIYTASYQGGLLAQQTNIGSYDKNVFAYLPSLDARLGYQVLPSLSLTVGYSFTYVSNVLRPGDQVDTSVNTTQIAGGTLVGPANPAVLLNDTSLWIQGVTAGLDFRF